MAEVRKTALCETGHKGSKVSTPEGLSDLFKVLFIFIELCVYMYVCVLCGQQPTAAAQFFLNLLSFY